jgi:uncharacterized membrane protein (DUF485 family)
MLELFAAIAISILLGLTIFQISLILGAPIARFAWGGQYDRLPAQLRAASVFSIVLYVIFALFIASKAQLVALGLDRGVLNTGMWLFTIYFIVGVIMNAASRSRAERYVMTPVAALLALAFLVVTLG